MYTLQEASSSDTYMDLALAAAEGFRCLSLSANGRQDMVGGAPVWYCSSTVPVFNGAAILYEHMLNPDTLWGIGEYFTTKGRPYSLLTMDALTPNAFSILRSMDFYQYDHMPAMWLDGLPHLWRGYSDNQSLWISQVTGTRDLSIFRSLLCRVFGIAPDEAELVMGEGALAVPSVQHYVGWLGNEAVGTISLVRSGPVPGIWNVGTLHGYRRRGIGAGLMRAVLHEAYMQGHTANMLLASKEGLPLYERLGYQTLSTLRVFVPKT